MDGVGQQDGRHIVNRIDPEVGPGETRMPEGERTCQKTGGRMPEGTQLPSQALSRIQMRDVRHVQERHGF